jgi:CRP-like cAMP-binding protein/Fe-S-cluster-containing hydrogenase component 2
MSTGAATPRDDQALWWDDEEGLFARDYEGRLLRMDPVTAADLDREVTITIDGREVTVKKAVPSTDEQGRLRLDDQGRVIPRATTIYDAATQLFGPRPDNPIPILCHREHMDPVAVCRLCVVQVAKFKARTGRVDVERKLMPACQHRVEETMIVDTIASPDSRAAERVRTAVGVLTELLMSDHPSPCPKQAATGDCELEALAARLGISAGRLPGRPAPRVRDDSSLVIAVDHDSCILCDRCVRACGEIADNHVIGRAGKGYGARIAFDLDAPMGASSCVACGECMVSCPTGALTHRTTVEAELAGGVPVPADELLAHPVDDIRAAFAGVAPPFLRFNARSVVRREIRPGEVICREGEFGSTAFLIERGSVEVLLDTALRHVANTPRGGWFGSIGRFAQKLVSRDEADDRAIPVDAPVSLTKSRPAATLGVGDLFGEMTCMSAYPRSATVRAGAEGAVVLELLRNVLYIMQRTPSFRRVIERKYRDRAIGGHLRSVALFAPLRADEATFARLVEELRPRVTLRRCEPGEVIFRQGEPARDGFYLVRTGFVKVSQERPGGEPLVLNYVGPGGYVGEIALLAELPELSGEGLTGVRTATCTALDHVDLVRIAPSDFQAIVDRHPEVRAAVIAEARRRLDENREAAREVTERPLGEFLAQGLMNAQSVLVLDLLKCTRCDECTRACADTHGGVTRLLREGLRFDRFLVASSCRSCLDPYCMVGCPVGSIRRRSSREIQIEDWCIGCGLCAENCPYGNINMVEQPGGARGAVVRKATTCDLCTSLGPRAEPSCVYACPHDAAHRMAGPDLLAMVRSARP